jgi:hypothetical protein
LLLLGEAHERTATLWGVKSRLVELICVESSPVHQTTVHFILAAANLLCCPLLCCHLLCYSNVARLLLAWLSSPARATLCYLQYLATHPVISLLYLLSSHFAAVQCMSTTAQTRDDLPCRRAARLPRSLLLRQLQLPRQRHVVVALQAVQLVRCARWSTGPPPWPPAAGPPHRPSPAALADAPPPRASAATRSLALRSKSEERSMLLADRALNPSLCGCSASAATRWSSLLRHTISSLIRREDDVTARGPPPPAPGSRQAAGSV